MVHTESDLLVVGAGISGLTLAHLAAARGVRTCVLESADRPGGCLWSHEFAAPAPGFWVELGAHTCFNSYGTLLEVLDGCGLTGEALKKRKASYRMLAGGELRSIFSRLHLPELLAALRHLPGTKKTGRSVREYYGRVLGERNYADVFGPAFNAVICQSADEFPADLLFRKKPRRKDVLRSFTMAGGLQRIALEIARRSAFALETGVEVVSVRRDGGRWTAMAVDGITWSADRAVIAVPPDTAAQLLTAHDDGLAAAVASISMTDIESFAVVVPAGRIAQIPMAGVIAVDDDFYSAVSRDTVHDSRVRGFTFHFKPGRLDEDGKRACAARVLGISPDDIAAHAQRINRLPRLGVGHARVVAEIDLRLAGGALGLTGNYFHGVSIEDCALRSAAELARLTVS